MLEQKSNHKADVYHEALLNLVKTAGAIDRMGNDLHVTVPISVSEAVLGRKKEIKTLGGKALSFEVPPGFNLRNELRIKGEGITSTSDLVIHLDIKTPKHLSSKAKKLLEDLEGEI